MLTHRSVLVVSCITADILFMEMCMLALTESAKKEFDAYFEGKDKTSIRIYLAQGGCSGPRLGLALDEPTNDDKTFDQGGYTFCINSALMDEAKSVSIDCSPMGFTVTSEVPFGASSGGCSGCSGGCS